MRKIHKTKSGRNYRRKKRLRLRDKMRDKYRDKCLYKRMNHKNKNRKMQKN